MTYSEIRAELRMYWDSGDPYGSLMSLFFPLAAVLTFEYGGTPPDWRYSPGAMATIEGEDPDLIALYREISESDLRHLGAVFSRAYRRIDARGDGY